MRTEELLALGVFGRDSRLGERIETLLARGREFSAHASGRRASLTAIALLGLVAAASVAPRLVAFAQGRPAFEAASVREVRFEDYGEPAFEVSPGNLRVQRTPFRELVTWAYRVDARNLSGGNLLDDKFYNITAKAAGPATPDEMRPMLQTLLEQRFKLALHREQKILPVYSLIVAKGGPSMPESKDPPRKGGRLGFTDHSFHYQMVGRASRLTEILPDFLDDRPVIDQTGLTAVYEIDLNVEMDPEQMRKVPQPGIVFNSFGYAPGVFDAVAKLGLKLESAKEPVEILVIDHVEKPDAN